MDTVLLSQIADTYPPTVGWYRCDENFVSTITFNGANLAPDPKIFPLIGRIRLFDKGEIIAEHFSGDIRQEDFEVVTLNDLIPGRKVTSGYCEITVLPKQADTLNAHYYNEIWGSVISRDGKVEINYPLLLTRAADISSVDSRYLYYPGIGGNDAFTYRLLVLNNQAFENSFEVILYDASGKSKIQASRSMAPKVLQDFSIEELFPQIDSFFATGPGLLVFRYQYKMNVYLQTVHREKQTIYGMDHLGLIYTSAEESEAVSDQSAIMPRDRLNDRIICFCKDVSEAKIRDMVNHGLSLADIKATCKAGTVCLGCVSDLEEITGERDPGCALLKEVTRTNQVATVADIQAPLKLEDEYIDRSLHEATTPTFKLTAARIAGDEAQRRSILDPTKNSNAIHLSIHEFEQASHYRYFKYDVSQPPMVSFEECVVCGDKMIPASCLTHKKGEKFLTLGVCPSCGFCQHTQRPPRAWYADFYRNLWDPNAKDQSQWPAKPPVNDRALQLLYSHAFPGQRVLEIGSGWGACLNPFKLAGFHPVGVEATSHRSAYIREKLGIPCMTGEAENIPIGEGEFQPESFDVIFSTNVLEHVYNTRQVIEHTYRLLKPNGLALLQVPTYYQENLTRNTHEVSHTCNFSHGNFSFMLATIGFDVVKDFSDFFNTVLLVRKAPPMTEEQKISKLQWLSRLLPHRSLAYILDRNGLAQVPGRLSSDLEMEIKWYGDCWGKNDVLFLRFKFDILRQFAPLIHELRSCIRKRGDLRSIASLLPIQYVYPDDHVPIWYY